MFDDMKKVLTSIGKEGARGISYGGFILWVLLQVWDINNERMMNTARVEVQAVQIQNLQKEIDYLRQDHVQGKKRVVFRKIDVPNVKDQYSKIYSQHAGMFQRAFGK